MFFLAGLSIQNWDGANQAHFNQPHLMPA